MRINQTYIVYSVFHLYVSILLRYRDFNSNERGNALLVITDHVPDYERLQARVSELAIFDRVILVHDVEVRKRYSEKKNALRRFFDRKRLLEEQFSRDLRSDVMRFIADSEINTFLDSTQFIQYLVVSFPTNLYRLYEDGERIYMLPKKSLSGWIKSKLLGYPKKHGRDSFIKEILVQQPQRVPVNISHKAKRIDYGDLVQSLTAVEKQKLVEVFMKEAVSLEGVFPRLLLLTQPLSEDGFISEEYKIALYERIISEYGEGFKIYLKPHPRELTDYLTCFENIELIPGSFPIELLNVNDSLHFDRGVTIFSTSLNNFKWVDEKVFLGIDWDDQLRKNFPFRTA